MTLEVGKQYRRREFQWRVLLWVPIVLAVGIVGFLLYDAINQQVQLRSEQSYEATVDQSLTHTVRYLENNYFDTSQPPASSEAYVRELTDDIAANFTYLFQTDQQADLSYTYAVSSQVTASYTPKGTTDIKTVWSDSYPLIRASSGRSDDGTVRIAEEVDIPFREYYERIERMNGGLALLLDAKTVVTFSVTVSGTANGLPVNEQRKMQMTVPLDQSVYAITTQYDRRDTVRSLAEVGQEEAWWRTYRIALMTVATIVAVGSLAVLIPWRRQSFERNPYRRELNRIYRYHDGLIIHTQKPFDMAGRDGLSVMSFDDLLNLSEELHVPIIASKLSATATRFIVIHDGTIYSYLVGEIRQDEQELPIPRRTVKKRTIKKRT